MDRDEEDFRLNGRDRFLRDDENLDAEKDENQNESIIAGQIEIGELLYRDYLDLDTENDDTRESKTLNGQIGFQDFLEEEDDMKKKDDKKELLSKMSKRAGEQSEREAREQVILSRVTKEHSAKTESKAKNSITAKSKSEPT